MNIMTKIIARVREQEELSRLYSNGRPEFTLIYGRRRVGKTFLVRRFFQDKFAFHHTALSPYDEVSSEQLNKQQLDSFHVSLSRYGSKEALPPDNWIEAFRRLVELLESKANGERMVVFIDELPWLDIQKSGFIPAFEHFWNNWGSSRDDLMLIVCGSSTAWVSEKLLNNTGGLYARTTSEIRLHPMNLVESEEFFKDRGIELGLYDLIQYQMILGGIPYYMNMIRKDLSLAANVDMLFFNKNSRLNDEFDRLMGSLFKHPENYVKVVRLLNKKKAGYTRNEIAEATGVPSGGGLTKILKSLEACDFITYYRPAAAKAKEAKYKLIDSFIIFYLNFVDGLSGASDGYWTRFENTPKLNSWRGIAFENLCFNHVPQIKRSLGISGVYTETSVWLCSGDEEKRGAQIDMVLDRDDRVINLCEMKFTSGDYVLDKEEEAKLRNRRQRFYDETHTKKAVHLTVITPYGLAKNKYSGTVQSVVSIEDILG